MDEIREKDSSRQNCGYDDLQRPSEVGKRLAFIGQRSVLERKTIRAPGLIGEDVGCLVFAIHYCWTPAAFRQDAAAMGPSTGFASGNFVPAELKLLDVSRFSLSLILSFTLPSFIPLRYSHRTSPKPCSLDITGQSFLNRSESR